MRRVKGLSPACDREKPPVVRTTRLLGQFLQPVAHPYSNSIFPYHIRPRCAAHGVLGHGSKGAFLSSRGLASCIAPGGKGLAMAAGTGQAWVSAAASLTRPGAPGQGGGQDKVLVLPPTSGGQGCSLGFRLVLKEDSGLGASHNESVSAQVVLGHSFVGVGTSGDRVGPSSPRTSWRHRAGCLLP